VRRAFLGQFLDVQTDDFFEAAQAGDRVAQTARKLLLDSHFRK
jgi:hypothetical protein